VRKKILLCGDVDDEITRSILNILKSRGIEIDIFLVDDVAEKITETSLKFEASINESIQNIEVLSKGDYFPNQSFGKGDRKKNKSKNKYHFKFKK